MASKNNTGLHREIGELTARMDLYENRMDNMEVLMREVRDTLIDTKGRVKGGVAVVLFALTIAGAVGAVITKYLHT